MASRGFCHADNMRPARMPRSFFTGFFEVLRFLDYKAVKLTMLISLITIIVGDVIYRRT